MKYFAYALSMGAILALTACGGGGGGAAPAAPLASVPLTTTNYDATGRASAATLVDVQSSTSIESLTSVASADSAPAQNSLSVFQIGRMIAGLGSATLAGRETPAASSTVNRACSFGGTLSATGNDANDNQRLDAGDSLTANFSGCVMESGTPALSGGLDITVNGATYSGSTLTALSITATFRSLSSGGSTLTGAADLTVNASAGSVAFHDTSSVRGGKTTVYNFTASVTTSGAQNVLAVSGPITIAGAGYTLSTPTPIVMGTVYPASGLLRVADSAGGRVDIVIRPADFDLDLYLPGDALRDAHATYTWAALASGSI